jgi:GTP cyclohydrolase III
MLPPEQICPNCGASLKATQEEEDSEVVHCDECDAVIDFREKEPVVQKKEEYVELFSTMNQGDIALIKSILDNASIDFYVLGENFLSVEPLVQPAKFYVAAGRVNDAKELLKEFKLHIYGVSNR